jgi:hypothetical protein
MHHNRAFPQQLSKWTSEGRITAVKKRNKNVGFRRISLKSIEDLLDHTPEKTRLRLKRTKKK